MWRVYRERVHEIPVQEKKVRRKMARRRRDPGALRVRGK